MLRFVFIVSFLLVAIFGLGPVLFADGAAGERTITLIAVLAIFALLFVIYRLAMKKSRN
jgi:hypothetical protein